MSGVKLVTGPDIEPVADNDLEEHLRITLSDDTTMANLIRSAREFVERITWRCLISQTWDYYLDEVPQDSFIILPKFPLLSVTSITTYDEADVGTVFASSNYRVSLSDEVCPRIVLKPTVTWPGTVLRNVDPMIVRLVAGYGTEATSVPEPLKQAIKVVAGILYEKRDTPIDELEKAVCDLIAPFRVWQV